MTVGTYNENIKIYKDINLVGYDQKDTIIDGQQKGPCLTISKRNARISGFTIQNGEVHDGGGIFYGGPLTVYKSSITDNKANNDDEGIYNVL